MTLKLHWKLVTTKFYKRILVFMFPVLSSPNDPVHFPGSGSASVHADPDPGGISLCGSMRRRIWIRNTGNVHQKNPILKTPSLQLIHRYLFLWYVGPYVSKGSNKNPSSRLGWETGLFANVPNSKIGKIIYVIEWEWFFFLRKCQISICFSIIVLSI